MVSSIVLPTLETNRLALLPWKLEYAEDMLIFASNENVINAAGGWKRITDVKKAREKIENWIKRNSDEWAIALKINNSNKIIGSIGMHKNKFKDYNFSFDFGYLIAEEFWGQGIATEAVQKLMQYAFMGLQCDVMTVYHKAFNNQSKRVIEKCKFKFRGIYPRHSQDNPDSNACYFLTREDYLDLYNVSEQDLEDVNIRDILIKYDQQKPTTRSGKPQQQTQHIKGSPYSIDNPVRRIDNISYIKEPTGYLCGQSCVAMLAGVSVCEVIKVIGTDKGTNKQDLKKCLDYYGIRYAPKSMRYDPKVPLPDLCVIRMVLPGYGHWGIYYKGIYYDPEFGILKECPSQAKIFQVWEIYT
ncbi:GNAT family N-acetyltransferase [Anaerocolumna sp. MB42-C2]|uniref:GNAT family N-acetyltransferase n=1 Tax=Anaerocolumna sp. MB42-C2 TaxID=3070997 RepID=UPI0027DEEF4E|nr:GNAT family N-acetyltransferase [Anaerocolumna sp. MB42-C2]WMJ90138.1 GNAT family N-acetyltransferase [Anaerocolumna sp. MB42-C2]